jgi:uncharacterized repeat protein (TIGR01451 family)
MGTWTRNLIRTFAVLAAVLLTARAAVAQTPENTVIRNRATVSYTDANNNAYADVSAFVDVTVGFAGGVDVSGAATVTPAAPSTGNVLAYTIQNAGNGTDSVTVNVVESVPGVITITGYRYNAITYATLALLNDALSTVAIVQGASITVDVLYDVPAGQGGNTTNVTLTGTSRRDNTRTDSQVTAVNPGESFDVAVTPDAQPLQQLPTGLGTPYSVNFTVTNNGNGPEIFDLSASNSGTAITIVSVNGVAGGSATLPSLAAGASATVAVVYTIGDVAAGTVDNLTLSAVAQANPATTDDGSYAVTVIRPALAMTKQAWLADRSAQISGPVLPGDFIEYRIQVTNTGGAASSSVVVTDALPAEVAYVSTEQDPAVSWTSITEASGTVTATYNGSLAPLASAFFWIRVRVL